MLAEAANAKVKVKYGALFPFRVEHSDRRGEIIFNIWLEHRNNSDDEGPDSLEVSVSLSIVVRQTSPELTPLLSAINDLVEYGELGN